MKVTSMLEKCIEKLESALTIISVAMLFIMMLVGSVDVIGRYVFNRPLTGAMEWSQMLLAGIILLCWGYVQATNSNIRLDFIIMRYPPRAKRSVEIAILIITLILFVVIIWQSAFTALQDFRQGRIIETILVPSFPFKLLVPFGALILCLEAIRQIVYLVRKENKKEEK